MRRLEALSRLSSRYDFSRLASSSSHSSSNWTGLGWWLGDLRRPSGDKNKLCKVGLERLSANCIAFYEADGQLGPHALSLRKYGKGLVTEGERWVLLEPAV